MVSTDLRYARTPVRRASKLQALLADGSLQQAVSTMDIDLVILPDENAISLSDASPEIEMNRAGPLSLLQLRLRSKAAWQRPARTSKSAYWQRTETLCNNAGRVSGANMSTPHYRPSPGDGILVTWEPSCTSSAPADVQLMCRPSLVGGAE